MTNLKEDELETFFNENLYSIVKKYGFDFSYADLREYKHGLNHQSGEELDDFLDQVAGGFSISFGWGEKRDKNGKLKKLCHVFRVSK